MSQDEVIPLVLVQRSAESCVEATLTVIEQDDSWRIDLRAKPLAQSHTGEGETLFDAFVDLRKRLDVLGWFLKCAGSCRNVYPSPMLRSMGDGRQAYRLTLGQQARTADLVDIFLECDPTDLVTVEEQEQFYEGWLKSLKGPTGER